MLLFKKIVSHLLSPVPLVIVIMLLGLFRLWFTNKQVSGKFFVTFGFILLLLLSNNHVSNYLTGYLENSHGPDRLQLSNAFSDRQDGDAVYYIVVLGGGHVSNPELPVTSQVNETTMVRLIEGIRLYRKYPGSKLILSGGAVFDPVPTGILMAQVAKDLGIPEEDILVEARSNDTKDEAVLIQKMVGDSKFILVTSAVHMYRSMAMFRKLGMNPVPAPAGHLFTPVRDGDLLVYFPSSDNLEKSQRAAHEYLGMVWASIRGHI